MISVFGVLLIGLLIVGPIILIYVFRQFLKPTLWKIVLSIIFIIIGLLLYSTAFGFGYSNPVFFYLSLIFMLPFILIVGLANVWGVNLLLPPLGTIIRTISFIITIFYNYVLACLVIYIFKRKRIS